MLILSKHIIKTSLFILLFTTTTNYLYAIRIMNGSKKSLININHNSTGTPERFNTSGYSFIISSDTITSGQNDGVNKPGINDNGPVPAGLINAPINFQVNSSIYYLNFKQFINAEAKKSFIQGWLKENELHRLSLFTDSLRKAYSIATDEEREKISTQILQSEQIANTLNEEIPAAYEKARAQENLYWQSASADEINQFQQKISRYEDSIAHAKQVALHSELSDTITVYLPSINQKEPEQKAEVPSGIIYKIQIGAFKGKIPESANKLIKKISVIRKVENQVDDKGVKVYTTGNLRSYVEAETMLSQVKQEGVKNAVITAYQNKKKIAIAEAKKLNNEL